MAATNSLLQVDGFGELAAAMSLATSAKKKNFLVYRDPHKSKDGTHAWSVYHFMVDLQVNLNFMF